MTPEQRAFVARKWRERLDAPGHPDPKMLRAFVLGHIRECLARRAEFERLFPKEGA